MSKAKTPATPEKAPKRKPKVKDSAEAQETAPNVATEAEPVNTTASPIDSATATPDAPEPTPELIGGYKLHPLCSAFPAMAPDRFAELKDSIAADGLDAPITLYHGAVLDGRNRLRACVETAIEPRFVHFVGTFDEALALVERRNLHRRDLTPSQRAMIAVGIKKQLEAEYAERQKAGLKKGSEQSEARSGNISRTGEHDRSRDAAAAVTGVNPRYVSDAERIEKESHEVAEAVKRGETTIPQAKRKLGIGSAPKPNPAPEPGPETVIQDRLGEPSASVEDFREAQDEREAKTELLSAEDWLSTLPLDSQLEGVSLKVFRRDALLYRRMDEARQAYANKARREIRTAKKGRGGNPVGPYESRLTWHIKTEHPKDWNICPPEDKGGCGGSGRVPSGPCPTCKECGYLPR